MAEIVMKLDGEFNGEDFFEHVEKRLPDYAVPLFVRISDAPDMTTTFKLRKVDLQNQGYDPTLVQEPLYIKDSELKRYSLYSEKVLDKILR